MGGAGADVDGGVPSRSNERLNSEYETVAYVVTFDSDPNQPKGRMLGTKSLTPK